MEDLYTIKWSWCIFIFKKCMQGQFHIQKLINMDDFEGFETSMEEVIADVVETARELEL